MKNNILKLCLIISILIGLVLFQREFFPKQEVITIKKDSIVYKDTTIYKDSLIPYIVKVPEPYQVEIPTDTTELIRRYLSLHRELFTIREYRDTFKIDTIGDIKIYQKVTQNKLDSISITPHLIISHIYTTNTIVEDPRNQWYIGGTTDFNGVAPIILFNSKGKKSYFISYDLVQRRTTVGILVNLNKVKLW